MNKNIWNLYKNTEKGKEAIALFTFDSNNDNLETKEKEIFQKYNEYLGGLSVEDYFLDYCFLTFDNIVADKLFLEENENASEYFIRLIDTLEISFVEENVNGELVKKANERPLIFQKDYKTFCGILSEISLILYFHSDLLFFPILLENGLMFL